MKTLSSSGSSGSSRGKQIFCNAYVSKIRQCFLSENLHKLQMSRFSRSRRLLKGVKCQVPKVVKSPTRKLSKWLKGGLVCPLKIVTFRNRTSIPKNYQKTLENQPKLVGLEQKSATNHYFSRNFAKRKICIDWHLAAFWKNIDWHFAAFCLHFDCILTAFSLLFKTAY